MNVHLQNILDNIEQIEHLSDDQKAAITKAVKDAEKEIAILEFKLDRTEKVKRTTSVLLEETIEELELKRKDIEEANSALQKSLEDLKAAQDQLVQQEKLASLGQLTAGIAHEIKNPLNFVNNFSELNKELIDEVFEELENMPPSDSKEEIISILEDVKSNLSKVLEHGSRADRIVKSMLQHSRSGDNQKSAQEVNPLIREFVNLSYHGMRAGKNPIQVNLQLDLMEDVGEADLIVEDFSRVILNICNNAFDSMREKLNSQSTDEGNNYEPTLRAHSSLKNGKILIEIEDNGTGIPNTIREKILQPFFTTKKGTEGTGLGLSITHDIIKAHGGELQIESKEGEGALFKILIPQKSNES
ncbi:sensor histidine kinase [Algoriphagus limi]|uniref:histidine kinase n=1 Tax=Algoriphagus limi TaxID=2975273 RepID=A0ABT2G7Q0_9BACT|nr:ATP-binding protein [Algoriphagus limi]MCS5491315.1 ATP-binding protein [Algoriphagus limi]